MKTLCQKILATTATIVALSGLTECFGENEKPSGLFAKIPMYYRSGAAMTTADFDKDGIQDLVVGTNNGGQFDLYFFKGFPGGKFSQPRRFATFPMYYNSGATITFGDFDKDGNQDLIVGTSDGGHLNLYRLMGDGKGNFSLR